MPFIEIRGFFLHANFKKLCTNNTKVCYASLKLSRDTSNCDDNTWMTVLRMLEGLGGEKLWLSQLKEPTKINGCLEDFCCVYKKVLAILPLRECVEL